MNASLVREIKKIIKEAGLSCSVSYFIQYSPLGWYDISCKVVLSENFIRYFSNKVDWEYISQYQRLSEKFIREFKNKVDWECISAYQKLSEKFIREFKKKLNLHYILKFQKLSEKFIREISKYISNNFMKNGYLFFISQYQELSEKFVLDHKLALNWNNLMYCQNLKKSFFKNCPIKSNFDWEDVKRVKSLKQKKLEMQAYAKKHNLNFDGKYLYAYRKHDQWGRGSWNKTIFYKVGKYYRDWHCDMNDEVEDSFGLGIWPKHRIGVNTMVKVSVKDWGCEVLNGFGKGRVWGFTVVKKV